MLVFSISTSLPGGILGSTWKMEDSGGLKWRVKDGFTKIEEKILKDGWDADCSLMSISDNFN